MKISVTKIFNGSFWGRRYHAGARDPEKSLKNLRGFRFRNRFESW